MHSIRKLSHNKCAYTWEPTLDYSSEINKMNSIVNFRLVSRTSLCETVIITVCFAWVLLLFFH